VSSLAQILAQQLISIHQWNDGTTADFMGYQCTSGVKGRIHSLKWVWDGRFSCPSWTSITGNSRGFTGRSGAIEAAIKDFITKALEENLITSEQANNLIGK